MSLERYFARAHDEARRLLRDTSWRPHAARAMPPGKRWRVFLDNGCSHTVSREASDDAADEVMGAYHSAAVVPAVVSVLRAPPGWLQRVLDRAMADTDGSPTLAAGEGAEARRLLELVAWDRVPQARWPEVFDRLLLTVRGPAMSDVFLDWESCLRVWLERRGFEAAERSEA